MNDGKELISLDSENMARMKVVFDQKEDKMKREIEWLSLELDKITTRWVNAEQKAKVLEEMFLKAVKQTNYDYSNPFRNTDDFLKLKDEDLDEDDFDDDVDVDW